MSEISQQTKGLISQYQTWYRSLHPEENTLTIHVDEVASKMASFYEKIRGVIDYRGEHLLKKTAIERKLKRRLLLNKIQSNISLNGNGNIEKSIAEPLIIELIQGGHFPNDTIKELKIKEVENSLNKYIFIIKNSSTPSNEERNKVNLQNWLIDIAACEIEEILSPPSKEKALINYMSSLIKERVTLSKDIRMEDKEVKTQIYIATQQSLFNLDSPLISYNLIKKWYLDWDNLSQEKLKEISEKIYLIRKKIEKAFHHPLSEKFYKVCERFDTPFLVLDDIISENLPDVEEKISEPEELETLIKKVYQKKVKTLKSKLGRAAFYSTVSIFITNILSLLVIEIPFTKYFTGGFNFFAIGVDILGPTFLMLFLVISIKPPKKDNLRHVILETMKIVYKTDREVVYGNIKIPKKRGLILKMAISIFYLITFLFSFGVIIWGLHNVNFPILSYVIFVIFISLIAFTGVKIRGRAKELEITPEKGTFIGFLLDLLSLPLLRVGKWLSIKWKKYNVIAIFFNSLIDMPFQIFVEFFDNLRGFLNEKKEGIH